MPKGGARPGAGRPPQTGEVKRPRTLKATQEEWNLILAFAKIVKHIDKQAAKKFVEQYKI